MAMSLKAVLAVAGGAALLASCAADPYYGDYAYNDGYYGAPAYYGNVEPGYYDPGYYAAPSIGFGIGFSDFDGHDHGDWHDRGDRGNWHGRGGDWHGDHGDHGGWHGDRGDHDHDGDHH